MAETQTSRSHWGSRIGFILAAAGSAVGLGNIWRFPYMAGENGGSIFILLYLACILFLGLPIIVAEVMLGKASQSNPVGAFKALDGPRSPWQVVGFMGVLAAFVILSFYSVVAGWCIGFIYKSVTGVFQPGHSAEEVAAIFGEMVGSVRTQGLCHGLFMILTVGIVLAGVRRGLERWTEILMPILIILLLVLVGYGLTRPGAMAGLEFMLKPDPSKLTGRTVLDAMGQCFFSLSLGMGAMLTYGSYMRREDRAVGSSFWVVVMDTGIALLAGFAVFPMVFAFGQQPDAGPGLVFKTMPAAFLQMPGGTWVALAFFILLLFAALTSAISLLEVVTAYFIDEFGMSRRTAAVMFGAICFLMGMGCVYGDGYLGFLDNLQGNFLLPVGALFISLFAGWKLDRQIAQVEFEGQWYGVAFGAWRWCIRIAAPLLVLLVILNAWGLFDRLFQG